MPLSILAICLEVQGTKVYFFILERKNPGKLEKNCGEVVTTMSTFFTNKLAIKDEIIKDI